MKRAFLQLFEHKSRDKQTKIIINEDTVKSLEKMISILSKSTDPILGPQTEKIKLIKEKTQKIILKTQKKEKDIEQFAEKIRQKMLIKDAITRQDLDSQSKEERYKKLENEILELDIELQKLERPEPLDPLKMIDVLLYSTDTDSELSVTDITKMFDKLSGKTPSHNLIYISNNLLNTVLKTYITRQIAPRKDFLDQTKKALSMVTKLPEKPGDLHNISGVVKNLQENFKNVFAHNWELYKNQIDLLADSLQLLLLIRGKLQIWIDVDKFVKQNNITSELLVNVVKKAKSPDGGGIFNLLGKDELKLLNNLVDKVELLTRDYWSFYNAFINPSSNSYLLLKVNTFRENLIEKLSVGFEPYKLTDTNKFINVKENFFETLEQTKTLIQIISSVIGNEESSIVLEYLGDNASRLNRHYHTQLVYTNLAIKQLALIEASYSKQSRKCIDKSEIDKLYPDYFLDIDIYFKNIKITNIIAEYIDIKNSAEQEYLSTLTHYNLKKKLSFLKSTQQVLNFFTEIFHYQNYLKDFKDFLTVLGLMQIDLEVSEFFKVIDVRNKLNLEFIRGIIYHLIVDIFKFFSFENIKSLDSLKTKPIQQKIKEIEMYLVKNTGPMIKDLVDSSILSESELLDNFSYLITSKNSLTSSKYTNPLKLLNLLISLSEYGEFSPEKLLTKETINKIITLSQDKIIKVIKEIDDINPYGKRVREFNINYDKKALVLFNLIDLGCINIEIMDGFLKIGIDPNKKYNGKKLLDSIAYQLTKVGRETDFPLLAPKKYVIDPEKQDQLIDIALHLIHNKADINSTWHKNGFLTTLFSLIPSGQSPYLYKKLLSDKEVISQLDLQEIDLWGRNLAHLFCKDLSEIFYSFTDPIDAKINIYNMLIKIIKSKNAHCELNKTDKEDNTPWHYLASSITADYVKLKTDGSFSQFTRGFNLSIKNIYGDTPLHIAFTQKAHPAAFYEFVLTDIYSPSQWLESPRLGLKIKNNQKQTVLDLIVKSKSNFIASVINTYMAVVNYKINLDDGSTFETIRSKVDTYLKGIPQVPADELERTIYLGQKYGSTKYDSSSSSSSLSPSSASSMSSSFSSSFPFSLTIGLDMETEHDWHPKTPLGESSDFTLHG
jgi:hypothetical protein